MNGKRSNTRRGRGGRAYVSKRKAIRGARKSNFTKAVKKVISSISEDKMAYFNFNPSDVLTMFNSGISGAADMCQVIPNVAQGTGDNNRVGDQIKVKNLNIRGYLRLTPKVQSGTFANEPKISNVMCRLMVVSLKSLQSYSAAILQPGYLSTLLKKGGTTVGYTGLLSDNFAPINSDVFTSHYDKTFYLTQDYDLLSTTATYVNSPTGISTKDTIKFFNINLKCKDKVAKYDTINGGIQPQNLGYFLLMGYTYLDGSNPDTLTTQVGMEYITTMRFEDH